MMGKDYEYKVVNEHSPLGQGTRAMSAIWKSKVENVLCIEKQVSISMIEEGLKANVSQEILNWHSLRHSHSADICIHLYCLS
jgi:hypothetical protein